LAPSTMMSRSMSAVNGSMRPLGGSMWPVLPGIPLSRPPPGRCRPRRAAQLIRVIATTSARFNAASDMSALPVARGVATVRYRPRGGYRPSRYDCDYTRGPLTQLPALFGRPPATVVHEACQVDGADACVYTVRWRPRRWLRTGRGRRRRRAGRADGAAHRPARGRPRAGRAAAGARSPLRYSS
jgi:hypothetical protein